MARVSPHWAQTGVCVSEGVPQKHGVVAGSDLIRDFYFRK